MDYGNALLYGLPQTKLSRIQRIQNHAARLVMNGRKYDHVTPLFIELHWLPVNYRIMFKVIITVFKCLNGLATSYLREPLNGYQPPRSLTSTGTNKLQIPR